MVLRRNWLSVSLLASALLGMVVVASSVVHAATFTIINADGPGEGFNDPAPRAPVGGNTGTTLGAQRLIAFQRAGDIWGGLLASSVTIRVRANFDPLPCNSSAAALGQASPIAVFRDFSGAILPGTWYPIALGNALHGSDLDPNSEDIRAQFSSVLGTTCSFPKGWYYGLDGNAGNDIDFISVVLHELGHGLGFLTVVDLATGAKLAGFNDTYMRNLEHHGASPADYPSMTDAQRVAASRSPGNLHWVGPNVRAASGILAAGKVGDHVRMYAPNPQEPGSSVSHWDTALVPNQLLEPFYTGPLQVGALELRLFQDIGWTLLSAPPTSAAPPPADFDGDGKSDISVYRPSTGTWFVVNSGSSTVQTKQWGLTGDLPVTGDYDGDRKADFAVYRPATGTWFIVNSGTSTVQTKQWGVAGDLPVPDDYDGDRKTDIAVYRPATGTWFIVNSSNSVVQTKQWGLAGDIPVPGDYDGDGKADIAVYRPATGTWFIVNSSNSVVQTKQWGLAGDIPVPGDYDGDGKTDIAVYRPATGTWFIVNSSNSVVQTKQWGLAGDIPVHGDYDGDRKFDIAVYRPATGTWFIVNSSNSVVQTKQWGVGDDQPLPDWLP